MEARDIAKRVAEEILLCHMQLKAAEIRESGQSDSWIGQRVADLAAELGWSQQRTLGAVRRLLDRGEIKATAVERRYSRFRRMTEVRYRYIEKLAQMPAWLMPTPFPVLGARRVSL